VFTRLRRFFDAWRSSETRRSLTLIVLAIVAGNMAFVIFGYEPSPIWWTASVSSRVCLWACGAPTLDPNVGYITQPLGHLAAMDLLHGHLPWWNYYEGLGQPLAGEMQSAALFPLTLLFLLPAGLLFMHLTLQFIAGAATYFLLRRLGLGATWATLAGALFALNGTFAWIGNAAVTPIAFMPLLLLGIERCYDSSLSRRRGSWGLVALAVAMSIYAGFPEMAYLDGLFCVGWAVTRWWGLERSQRRGAAARVGLGGVVGVTLALPIIVPFFDFIKEANIGAHAAQGLSAAQTSASSLPILVNPFLSGVLFGGSSATPNNLLGYFTATVGVFALVGLFGPRLRALRWFLAGWILLVLAGVMNFLELRHAWNLIPAMKTVAFARYIWPTTELAAIILAVAGLSDLVERGASRSLARWSTLGVTLFALSGVFLVSPLGDHITGSYRIAVVALIVTPFVALAATAYVLTYGAPDVTRRALVAIMVAESVVYFAVPAFRSPLSLTMATDSITYLQTHQGLHRFVTLGVITPNWGSQYGLNEINAIDLPLPTTFDNFIHNDLAPSLNIPRTFMLPFTPGAENEVAAHIANYESLGVLYVVTQRKPLTPALLALGMTEVAHDAQSVVYQLPQAEPFYVTQSPCAQSNVGVDHVNVTCAQATTLTRLEMPMAGWTARVNGVVTPLSTSPDGLRQVVSLPAGTSTVTFDFLPPHEVPAAWAAALALAVLPTSWMRRRRPRRTRRHADAPDTSPPEDVITPVEVDVASFLHDVGETEQK